MPRVLRGMNALGCESDNQNCVSVGVEPLAARLETAVLAFWRRSPSAGLFFLWLSSLSLPSVVVLRDIEDTEHID